MGGVLPAPTPVPSGVQTASVDSAGSGISSLGATSSDTMRRGQALFPNDPIFRTFKRGGDVRSGIGGLFR